MENESNYEVPTIDINIDGEKFEATPYNTALFKFVGSLAMYDHVFLSTDPENNSGTYVFNQNPMYKELEDHMFALEFPVHANIRFVPNCDLYAFEQMVKLYTDRMPNTIPEDWL